MKEYAAAGLHVDQPWGPDDYVAAEHVIEKAATGHRERLPRFHGATSGPVFAKLLVDLPDDSAEPVAKRYVAHMARLGALNGTAKLYLPNQLDTPPREWIELMGAILREAVLLERDSDAFIASFGSDDPDHAARMKGRDQMGSGYGAMLLGGILVADRKDVPEDDRVAQLEYVAAAIPTLFPRVKPDTQRAIRDAIGKQVAGFPAGRLATAASAVQRALPN